MSKPAGHGEELRRMLETIAQLSREYGRDPDFVLGGGGNTSVKDAGTMWVKPSGSALADMTADSFIALDLDSVKAMADRDYPADTTARETAVSADLALSKKEPAVQLRPSVESLLHALLEYRFVVHLHPWKVNALTCCTLGETYIRELFGGTAAWVDFQNPGLFLAKAAAEKIAETGVSNADTPILFLENHGVFVAADEPRMIRDAYSEIIRKIDGLFEAKGVVVEFAGDAPEHEPTLYPPPRELLFAVAPALRGLLGENDFLPIVRLIGDPRVHDFLDYEQSALVISAGSLTPDHIVHCGPFPAWVENAGTSPDEARDAVLDAVDAWRKEHGRRPRVILAPGAGAWAVGITPAAAEMTEMVFADGLKIASAAMQLGGIHPLEPENRGFIEGWEMEGYRAKRMSAAKGGRAGGKAAVVTGAAQGIGRGLAEGLAAEGAFVCVMDINENGVEQVAAEISAEHGKSAAAAVKVDVSDPGSVLEALEKTVRLFGGCDLFLSNAGVLRAGAVTEMSAETFRFVTEVNYGGFFNCVKAAVPVMAVQHEVCPQAWFDIIQVNSKSGLRGSRKNAAYAGSKFGGIGLVQSFALELVEDGIKVNAVCPGNYFDGPLWSDPENGLFKQYLEAGKVPGAKSVEDIRRHYESLVPMSRGCRVGDILKAVLYIIEQEYETGQALPLTGGQVMLS